jgi:hypothetical protein
MDPVMPPTSHSHSAHFKLLGHHHGDHQETRDSGDQAGGARAKGAELTSLGRAITTAMERMETTWVPLQEQTVVSNALTKRLETKD